MTRRLSAMCGTHGTRLQEDGCEECADVLASLPDTEPSDDAACVAEMRAEHEADVRRMSGDE